MTANLQLPAPPPTLERESLPFTLNDVRRAIPPHCFQANTARSLAYFALDLGLVALLYWAAVAINQL